MEIVYKSHREICHTPSNDIISFTGALWFNTCFDNHNNYGNL